MAKPDSEFTPLNRTETEFATHSPRFPGLRMMRSRSASFPPHSPVLTVARPRVRSWRSPWLEVARARRWSFERRDERAEPTLSRTQAALVIVTAGVMHQKIST